MRPELVVEIAFSDVQESPRYPAGLALRFARVKRYREDKPARGRHAPGRPRDLPAPASLNASTCVTIPGAPEEARRGRSTDMVNETRRTFAKAGVAGVVVALVPGARRASADGLSREDGMTQGPRTVELPGFVDLQVNGFAGVDFTDPALTPERMLEAVSAIEKTGVTRFLPTLITSSLETFSACARAVVRTKHAAIVGIHMEGPYISPEDGPRGAHLRRSSAGPTWTIFGVGRTRRRDASAS